MLGSPLSLVYVHRSGVKQLFSLTNLHAQVSVYASPSMFIPAEPGKETVLSTIEILPRVQEFLSTIYTATI